MRKFGLLGRQLSHSFSKKYFTDKFRTEGILASYENYELDSISEIHKILGSDLEGFNVTNPYKEKILPFLHGREELVEQIGAVNTVKRSNDHWIGYNTDVIGFRNSLLELDLPFDMAGSRSLIFGTGGASRSVDHVLRELGSSTTLVSRSGGDLTYTELRRASLSDHDLLVNTTPVGTYPYSNASLDLNWEQLRPGQLVYDLVYNPNKTVLLHHAERQGAMITNGHRMLVLQAEAAWDIWNSTTYYRK